MEIGIIGLGRMGASMARRLARGGRAWCATTRPRPRSRPWREKRTSSARRTLPALCARLDGERVIVLSLPAGAAVEDTIRDLVPLCSAGDTIVDCGNSYYKDSMRRALALVAAGAALHRRRRLGRDPRPRRRLLPDARRHAEVDRDLRAASPSCSRPHPERGWLHCGPSGAGHFAKMIHNGIEYGMMQALAEGFALLAARRELDIDVARLAETWRHGSVVRSWLLDLCVDILKDENLDGIAPVVADSGEGRWTALESIELGVPAPAIAAALMNRFSSQGRSDYTRRLLAMMRARFGGHPTEKLRPG